MADLDPALQDSIDNLQTRHTALVNAVRNHTGGSIAQGTNDLLAARDDVMTTVEQREKALLGMIQANTTAPAPSLLLDFRNQIYMQGTRRLEHGYAAENLLTIERASTKRVMGSQGTLVEVPPNTLAYEYDAVTGDPLGVLSERMSTNLLPYSEDFSQWDIVEPTVTTGETAPDGSQNATLVEVTAVGRNCIIQNGVGPNETRQSASVHCKAGTATHVCLMISAGVAFLGYAYAYFDLVNGVPGETGGYGETGNSNITVGMEKVGDYYRCWMSVKTGTNPNGYRFAIQPCRGTNGNPGNNNSDAEVGDTMYIWGAQLEERDVPTSYIPSLGSATTRTSDSISRILGSEFPGINGQWTVVVEYTCVTLAGNQRLISINPAGDMGAGHFFVNGNVPAQDGISANFNSSGFLSAKGMDFSQPVKVAITRGPGRLSMAATGNPVTEATGVEDNAVAANELHIGTHGGVFNALTGHIRSVRLYPMTVSNEQLEALIA